MYVRGAPVSKMKCAATLRPRADTGKVTSTRSVTAGVEDDAVDWSCPGLHLNQVWCPQCCRDPAGKVLGLDLADQHVKSVLV